MTKILLLANASSALLRCWAKLENDDYQITLVSINEKDKSLKDIEFQRVAVKKSTILSYLKLLFKIRRIIRKVKPDIIISHFTIHHGVIADFSRFHPHIAVVYGSDVFRDNLILRIINRRVLRRADKIIVSAENTKNHLSQTYHIDSQKVITKSWGIKCDLFNTTIRESQKYKTDIMEELALKESGKYILSPRLIGPVYNHEIILEAFTLINQKYPEYKLIMMHYNLKNTDKYWNQLREYSNQLGIADKIIWTQRYLTSEEMADIFAKAEVMINIPKYDQLASTVLEGISSGCFVIVSDLKPYYEVVKDGFNGFILDENTPEAILEAFDKYKKEQNQFDQNTLAYAKEIQEQYKEEYFIDHIRQEIKSLVSKYTNSN